LNAQSRIRVGMLGLDFIKANRAAVEKAIADKGVDLDLDALLALDGEVRALKTALDGRRRRPRKPS
jgi:seryl-tRNA synthetase